MIEQETGRTRWFEHWIVYVASDRAILALGVVMVIGLGLRLWGIGYGLPYLYHPDEPLGASIALRMLKTGDLNPHFFGYGSLFFYLNALAYVPYYLLGQAVGLFQTPVDIPDLQSFILGVGRSLMPSQIVLGRLVSVAVGMLCIPASYWLGRRLSNPKAALLAAALVALSPTLVLHSQFITPNTLVTLAILLTLVALVRLTPTSRWPSYALAGIALGLAVASKYNAAILIFSCVPAFFMLQGWNVLRRPESFLVPATAVFTFVAVTPYAILDFPKFLEDTQFHLTYYSSVSHPGMEGIPIAFYVPYLLSHEGLIVFVGMLPVLSYLRGRSRTGLILAAFAIPYLAYILTLRLRNDRTILLVLPVLLIMAADGISTVWRRVASAGQRRVRQVSRTLLLVGVGVSLAYLAGQTIVQNIRQTLPDAREYARQWIDANVSREVSIAAEIYSPFIDPDRHPATYLSYLYEHPPEWYVEQGYDLLVLSSGAFYRFYAMPERYPAEIAAYEALTMRFTEIARFDQNNGLILILQVTR